MYGSEVLAVVEEEGCTWMTPIYEYVMEEILPEEKRKARAIRCKAGRGQEINKGSAKAVRFTAPCQGPQQNLTPITYPWPFYKYEIDIAGPFPEDPDLLEEKREQAAIQEAKSKVMMEKYYNSKVRSTSFKPEDLIYRSNDASRTEEVGKLGPKWEGPYEITKALGKGAYKLRNRDGKQLPQNWNVRNLKRCYVHEM
nr:reverse transcriptase domain-containing protein [Tanacetum cinerariifolium]